MGEFFESSCLQANDLGHVQRNSSRGRTFRTTLFLVETGSALWGELMQNTRYCFTLDLLLSVAVF